jgi:opacity protein-like surface antigen
MRWGRIAAGAVAAVLAQWTPAASSEVALISPVSYSYYVGGGFGVVHNTGYDPTHRFSVEHWRPGGKVFGGFQVTDWVRLEVAYHFLGISTFTPDGLTQQRLRSQAVAGSAMFVTPVLIHTPVPTRIFGRVGLAYKDIHQTMPAGTLSEGILAFVAGGGLEFDITSRIFLRAEYEYISTAIGGPLQPVPGLNGLFVAKFGGTHRTINVMGTGLTASAGFRF